MRPSVLPESSCFTIELGFAILAPYMNTCRNNRLVFGFDSLIAVVANTCTNRTVMNQSAGGLIPAE
jgi:hypothetical protein